MVDYDVHEDYNSENDIYSVEWLDEAIIIPSNLVADIIANCYVNQWFDVNKQKNAYKVKARIKVIMKCLVTREIVMAFGRVGANPKIEKTETNKDFIQYLKNVDVEKQAMDIFKICTKCYPDWIKRKFNEDKFMLDSDGNMTNKYGFSSLSKPRNLQKYNRGWKWELGKLQTRRIQFFNFFGTSYGWRGIYDIGLFGKHFETKGWKNHDWKYFINGKYNITITDSIHQITDESSESKNASDEEHHDDEAENDDKTYDGKDESPLVVDEDASIGPENESPIQNEDATTGTDK